MKTSSTSDKTAQAAGLRLFYREAGDPKAPAVLGEEIENQDEDG